MDIKRHNHKGVPDGFYQGKARTEFYADSHGQRPPMQLYTRVTIRSSFARTGGLNTH